jgi:hypothetical protein
MPVQPPGWAALKSSTPSITEPEIHGTVPFIHWVHKGRSNYFVNPTEDFPWRPAPYNPVLFSISVFNLLVKYFLQICPSSLFYINLVKPKLKR